MDDAADADLIVLNTCHIREKAAEKVYSELGRLRHLKERSARAGRPVLLAVAGCVAQAEGAELLSRAPYVDIVVGPQTYQHLSDMVGAWSEGSVIETDFPADAKFDSLPEPILAPGATTAFLTVQEGCDKFCTFCVVPYTRGAEYSVPSTMCCAKRASMRTAACGRSLCSARTSTATMARLRRRRVAAGQTDTGARRNRRHPADSLYDVLSGRS